MRRWIPLALIAAAALFSTLVYPRLPARIPTHWGMDGVPDGWSGRAFGAFVLPLVMAAVLALFRSLPRLDPRRANYEKFGGTYDLVVTAVIAMLLCMHVLALGVALGWPVPIGRLAPLIVGALLMVVGNVLPRARSTWFFGIRTPWTLSSDRVWERTHRVGGYMMIVAGATIALSGLLWPRWGGTTAVLIGAALGFGLLAYSYVAWRRETAP